MKIAIILLYTILLSSFTFYDYNQTTLNLSNLNLDLGGDVRVQVFKKQPINLMMELEPIEKFQVPLIDAAHIKLPALEPGEYMISVFHDNNKNGKMDYNLLGKPKEGYGFSGEFYCGNKNSKPESYYVFLNSGNQQLSINLCY
ncbi:DUF2141 domain-containing protein [Cyclobacterium sp. 1_MG-2023]|uniref:DUF2141 domain-containing protein n=1 Tax=Cyclobacterium sp. 1_MG-2023 TaxID=3062681 RepID=UPI0026E2A4CA|nr:DUF2141 domain-containing protein [Cyclobacterium sp. 1_MG-2023]MDO6436211.1 DUF2141 domain-containing protein [Cyclobacterium sp. 1_MG-2023]